MVYGYTSRDKNGTPRTGANVDELLQKIEDLENATHETAGLMSAADKTKLDAQEASPSIVGMRWTRNEQGVWNFGGHTYSELQGYASAGVPVVVEIVTENNDTFYELLSGAMLVPLVDGYLNDNAGESYVVTGGSSDSIVIDTVTIQYSVEAHNALSITPGDKREAALYGDKVINGSVVTAASVVVDDNGVSITATNGAKAKYNGSEIATEASIEGWYFAS